MCVYIYIYIYIICTAGKADLEINSKKVTALDEQGALYAYEEFTLNPKP